MQNGAATLEDTVVVSDKTKCTLPIRCSNHTPWYLPKGVKNSGPYQNLHMDVYKLYSQPPEIRSNQDVLQ